MTIRLADDNSRFIWKTCIEHKHCTVMQVSEDQGKTWITVQGCRVPEWAGEANQ